MGSLISPLAWDANSRLRCGKAYRKTETSGENATRNRTNMRISISFAVSLVGLPVRTPCIAARFNGLIAENRHGTAPSLRLPPSLAYKVPALQSQIVGIPETLMDDVIEDCRDRSKIMGQRPELHRARGKGRRVDALVSLLQQLSDETRRPNRPSGPTRVDSDERMRLNDNAGGPCGYEPSNFAFLQRNSSDASRYYVVRSACRVCCAGGRIGDESYSRPVQRSIVPAPASKEYPSERNSHLRNEALASRNGRVIQFSSIIPKYPRAPSPSLQYSAPAELPKWIVDGCSSRASDARVPKWWPVFVSMR